MVVDIYFVGSFVGNYSEKYFLGGFFRQTPFIGVLSLIYVSDNLPMNNFVGKGPVFSSVKEKTNTTYDQSVTNLIGIG